MRNDTVCSKVDTSFKGKPPARVFPLFKPKSGFKIHLFLRFLHGQGISPSAECDKGCSPLTSVAFLKKSDAKKFNMCVV